MRTFALFTLLIMIDLSTSNAQVIEQRRNEASPQQNTESNKEMKKEQFAKELNLSQKQRDDLEKLKGEAQVERGRMHDKHKAEKMVMRDNFDKRLRSILDEKQYYAFKAKMKKHGRKMRSDGHKKDRGGSREGNRD